MENVDELQQEIHNLNMQCSEMMDINASLQTNNTILSNFIMSTYDISGIDVEFIACGNIRTYDICGNLIGCVTTDESDAFVPCSDNEYEDEMLPCVLPPDLSNNMHVHIKENGVRELGARPRLKPKPKSKDLYDYPGFYPQYCPSYYSPYKILLDDEYAMSIRDITGSKPRAMPQGQHSQPPGQHSQPPGPLGHPQREYHDYNRWNNWSPYRWHGPHGPYGPNGPYRPNKPYRDMSCN